MHLYFFFKRVTKIKVSCVCMCVCMLHTLSIAVGGQSQEGGKVLGCLEADTADVLKALGGLTHL